MPVRTYDRRFGGGGRLTFNCDGCKRKQHFVPGVDASPLGAFLVRQYRRRRGRTQDTPPRPSRCARLKKWQDRKWAALWQCARCLSRIWDVRPTDVPAILRAHRKAFVPSLRTSTDDDDSSSVDSSGAAGTDWEDEGPLPAAEAPPDPDGSYHCAACSSNGDHKVFTSPPPGNVCPQCQLPLTAGAVHASTEDGQHGPRGDAAPTRSAAMGSGRKPDAAVEGSDLQASTQGDNVRPGGRDIPDRLDGVVAWKLNHLPDDARDPSLPALNELRKRLEDTGGLTRDVVRTEKVLGLSIQDLLGPLLAQTNSPDAAQHLAEAQQGQRGSQRRRGERARRPDDADAGGDADGIPAPSAEASSSSPSGSEVGTTTEEESPVSPEDSPGDQVRAGTSVPTVAAPGSDSRPGAENEETIDFGVRAPVFTVGSYFQVVRVRNGAFGCKAYDAPPPYSKFVFKYEQTSIFGPALEFIRTEVELEDTTQGFITVRIQVCDQDWWINVWSNMNAQRLLRGCYYARPTRQQGHVSQRGRFSAEAIAASQRPRSRPPRGSASPNTWSSWNTGRAAQAHTTADPTQQEGEEPPATKDHTKDPH